MNLRQEHTRPSSFPTLYLCLTPLEHFNIVSRSSLGNMTEAHHIGQTGPHTSKRKAPQRHRPSKLTALERLELELRIDGTGLDPRVIPPRKRPSYKWKDGSRYEVAEAKVSQQPARASDTRTRKASQRTGGAPERHSKRSRITASRSQVMEPSGTNDSDVSADAAFLADCKRQYKGLKSGKATCLHGRVSSLLRFLDVVALPDVSRVQTHAMAVSAERPPEAFVMAPAEARSLLASNSDVFSPVIVPGGAKGVFIGDTRRPIVIALTDWLMDPVEKNETAATDKKPGEDFKQVTTNDLRKRFLPGSTSLYPWNLPDVANPMADQSIPSCLESANCNFLRALVRRITDLTGEDVCPEDCPNQDEAGCGNKEHKLTMKELTALHDAWWHWQGTLCMAEPGATTPAHFDKYSLGTWLACYEGEIGFCWQSHPTDEQRVSWKRDTSKPDGKYLYQVLRPGDAMYMPPGQVHVVFRRPEGGPTFMLGGHVLRKSAIDQWLHVLNLETAAVIKGWKTSPQQCYSVILPPLVDWTKFLLSHAETKGARKMCGGKKRVDKANRLIRELEKKGTELRKLARKSSKQASKAPEGSMKRR